MKIIEYYTDKIADEIKDAKNYAMKALEIRDTDPDQAQTLYELSVEEMEHMAKLHGMVVGIIEKYRQEKGEPPADMLARYNYLHKKAIEKAAKVKNLQAMFKES